VTDGTGVTGGIGGTGERPRLRRDAERNRQRIIAAAREVFQERGTAATLNDVAHHAGVGVGTVYRRFPNKEVLVDALFEDMVNAMERYVVEALAVPDAWTGLLEALERMCELQAFDRGLREVLLGMGRGPERQIQVEARIGRDFDRLLDRAREQGALRADAVGADMPVIQLMLGAVSEYTATPGLWRRYLYVLMDGMRAHPENSALPAVRTDQPIFTGRPVRTSQPPGP